MRSPIHRQIALHIMNIRREATVEINKHLAPVNASAPMYALLFRLVNEAEVPQLELASDAALDRAGVCRLVARMAEEGLVATRTDPDDRRQRLVRITRRGRALERALAPIIDHAVSSITGGLDEKEQRQLLSLLQKACARLRPRRRSEKAATAESLSAQSPRRSTGT
jgi:DNA-binding MarR family transcriptional regulator